MLRVNKTFNRGRKEYTPSAAPGNHLIGKGRKTGGKELGDKRRATNLRGENNPICLI